jgi:2-polyprenyl-6-methoxyphenol hydroxylase-like FAD-dependent oxidoreductase
MFSESEFSETAVLIAGAGPTGLTLAIELQRRGVPHRIVERADGPQEGSRGKGLQPRTLEILEDLGVLAAFQEHGAAYPVVRVHRPGGELLEWWMDEPKEPTPDVPYPNVLMVPQWRTTRLLLDRLTELGGRVEFGAEVTGLAGTTATLGSGETIAARYVVGCDGGRSTIRRLIGATFEGETREQESMLVADVRVTGLDRDHWHIWPSPAQGFRLGLCPLPGTEDFQLTAPLTDVDGLPALLAEVAPGVEITGVGWRSVYRPNIRMVSRFRHGDVFLAGDAAHVHSPAGGQGLNTGIQDAYNLGWKLASGDDALLDTYEAERLPVAANVLGISTRLHDSREFRRNDPTLRQLKLSYSDGVSAKLTAGDRAPDAPCGPTRLFDVFRGTHSTLLAFDVDDDVLPEDSADLHVWRIGPTPGDRTLVDVDGHAHHAYGVEEPTLFWIRPDGYVGRVMTAATAPAL